MAPPPPEVGNSGFLLNSTSILDTRSDSLGSMARTVFRTSKRRNQEEAKRTRRADPCATQVAGTLVPIFQDIGTQEDANKIGNVTTKKRKDPARSKISMQKMLEDPHTPSPPFPGTDGRAGRRHTWFKLVMQVYQPLLQHYLVLMKKPIANSFQSPPRHRQCHLLSCRM